jgi:hypothetical protein
VERVVGVSGGDSDGGVGLVGLGGGLGEEVAVVVVGVGDGARLGVSGGGELA